MNKAKMSAGRKAQEMRIILIGKTGVGKSSTGNNILGKDVFHKAVSSKSVTKQCRKATAVFDDKNILINVTIVDTPGLYDTDLSEGEITEQLVNCIDLSCPGPHVFLLVLTIGNRYTNEEKQTVQKIQEIFGEAAARYTMILFTNGDKLEDLTFEDYLKDAADDLKALIDKCDGRCHVFNNRDRSGSQVSKLLQSIQDMVKSNGGECFTNTTYQLLKKYKRREAELQLEIDDARREKEAREAEIQRLVEQDHERRSASVFYMLEHMDFQYHIRRKEEERTQKRLNAQAAEHQRMIDLERQKLKELERKHQRYTQEETRRKNEESINKRRLESLEKEKQEIQKKYEASVRQLEEEKRRKKAEMDKHMKERIGKKKNCIIS